MAGRRAIRHVAKRISQNAKIDDLLLKFIGPTVQFGPGDIQASVLAEHSGDLGKREPGLLAERNQVQLQQDIGIKLPSQPASPEGLDQSDFFIVPERRWRNTRSCRDFTDIHFSS